MARLEINAVGFGLHYIRNIKEPIKIRNHIMLQTPEALGKYPSLPAY